MNEGLLASLRGTNEPFCLWEGRRPAMLYADFRILANLTLRICFLTRMAVFGESQGLRPGQTRPFTRFRLTLGLNGVASGFRLIGADAVGAACH